MASCGISCNGSDRNEILFADSFARKSSVYFPVVFADGQNVYQTVCWLDHICGGDGGVFHAYLFGLIFAVYDADTQHLRSNSVFCCVFAAIPGQMAEDYFCNRRTMDNTVYH